MNSSIFMRIGRLTCCARHTIIAVKTGLGSALVSFLLIVAFSFLPAPDNDGHYEWNPPTTMRFEPVMAGSALEHVRTFEQRMG